ncbi:MAG: alpha/beta hydrolase [Mycobacterium sp.]|nr:alpha/beta hydrolase [Mycobacterium sp.]
MFVPRIDKTIPLTLIPSQLYGNADGVELSLDLVLPQQQSAEPYPVAVWLFGGGWSDGSRTGGVGYWCSLLAAHGIASASVDYRLSGDAPFPAQIHDVKAAIRWVRANAATYGIDPDRIGIWGHSAGGHLAALAALTGELPQLEGNCGTPGVSSRIQAAAIASANTDFLALDPADLDHPIFTQFFGGTRAEREDVIRLASPLTHVQPEAPPFLIAHGTLDETVPFSQSERLHDALVKVGAPVEFVPIEGGYHNWNPQPERAPRARYHDFAYLALRFFQTQL